MSMASAWALRSALGRVDPPAPISVSGGDTTHLNIGGREETVRLILIDTSVTRDPNDPPECYGAEATAVLEQFGVPLPSD